MAEAAAGPSATPPMIRNDKLHKHPLVLRKAPMLFTCKRCKCKSYGWRYVCRQCKFFVHDSCATCPESIDFFMHPSHTLTLQRSYNPVTRHKCEACGESAHGYFYRCKPCSYELHPFCARLRPTINDAAHPGHTLRYASTEKATCGVCGKECIGSRYTCEECPVHVHIGCLAIVTSAMEKDTLKSKVKDGFWAVTKVVGYVARTAVEVLAEAVVAEVVAEVFDDEDKDDEGADEDDGGDGEDEDEDEDEKGGDEDDGGDAEDDEDEDEGNKEGKEGEGNEKGNENEKGKK